MNKFRAPENFSFLFAKLTSRMVLPISDGLGYLLLVCGRRNKKRPTTAKNGFHLGVTLAKNKLLGSRVYGQINLAYGILI